MICSLCKEREVLLNNQALGVCHACADAIVALPPSRRPARPCRHCDGRSFVRVVPRDFSVRGLGNHVREVVTPMRAVKAPSDPARPAKGWGLLEMFVCRACDAVEWYCHDAANIPIGVAYNTELVEYPAEGTYR